MKTIITLIIGLLVTAVAIVAVSYAGIVNIAAVDEDPDVIHWLLHNTYEHSLDRAADSVSVPADLGSEQQVLRGAQNYQAMCSGCHIAPGEQATAISQGLNPAAPELTHIAEDLTPEKAFWVIRNGVKMSGMAAFGPTHDDTELWALVAFIESMDGASAEQYQAIAAQARSAGLADDGHDHEHGNAVGGTQPEQDHEAAAGASDDAAAGDSAEAHDDGHSHDQDDAGHGMASTSLEVADNAQAQMAAQLGDALSRGDESTVRKLLDENVLIFESGGVESSMEEYAGHHMPADMAFMQAMDREVLSRKTFVEPPMAVVATRSRLSGEYRGQTIDTTSTETLVLRQSEGGNWQVVHIHWSSS